VKRVTLAAVACALVAPVALPTAAGAAAGPKVDFWTAWQSQRLQKAVTVDGMMRHEREFQAIADRNGGTRASGTRGFDQSVDYVSNRLRAAGYDVTVQPFSFPFYDETGPATLERTGDGAKAYTEGPDADFTVMQYSGSGDVTGTAVAVDPTLPPTPEPSSTSGCDPADFAGFPAGGVAVIQRGTCTFATKVDNAVQAGAAAVIIYNEGQPGRTDAQGGTLGDAKAVPVLFTSFATGQELVTAAQAGTVTLHIVTSTINETRTTYNVIADSRGGDPSQTLVVGSHLDSVPEGPGINDDGSGSAQDLEIAEELPKVIRRPHNRIRFAFWGAEESGLLGSTYYVQSLTQEQRDAIFANLNFDMVASPNFARLVYDGDGSDSPDPSIIPVGSDLIEGLFVDYFTKRGLATAPTAFDGRSDYGPFIEAGIPAGGTFSGAEGLKSADEVALFGGTADEAYDPCYHQACDRLTNLNLTAFDQFSDAAAHAVAVLAARKTPLTDNESSARRTAKAAPAARARGPQALR
jgi:Zn-dependent M28 family amino/carboxypeptidase